MSTAPSPTRRRAALGCVAALLVGGALVGAPGGAAVAPAPRAHHAAPTSKAKAPRAWMAGMNVVSFQAGDLDDFDARNVKTATTIRTQMGIDRAVFTPGLYFKPSTGHLVTQGGGHRTVTTKGLVRAATSARAHGLAVTIKPHVDPVGYRGSRTTAVDPRGADRTRFWQDYSAYIVRYAALAQRVRASYFVVGTELSRFTTPADDARWRALIKAVRRKFTGNVTFAANYDAIDEVTFWDALDAVSADYFFTGSGYSFATVYDQLEATATRARVGTFFFTELGSAGSAATQAGRYRSAFAYSVKAHDQAFRGFWWYDWYAFRTKGTHHAYDAFTPRPRAKSVLCAYQVGCTG